MRSRNLFRLTEAPGCDHYSIAGVFEPLDNRGEEVDVRRVIQVDPDAHFKSQRIIVQH
jgi:hypothetical protein